MSALIPNIWTFLGLTLVLGGSAALVSGRAVSRIWLGAPIAVAAMLPMACAICFLHYALFWEETTLANGCLCFTVLSAFSLAGFYIARRRQMGIQYPWVSAGGDNI